MIVLSSYSKKEYMKSAIKLDLFRLRNDGIDKHLNTIDVSFGETVGLFNLGFGELFK